MARDGRDPRGVSSKDVRLKEENSLLLSRNITFLDACFDNRPAIKRSSSSIESLNSRFRVLQLVHRTVTDEMLALLRFAWNLTPGRDGRSPWARLGLTSAN